MIRRGKTEGWLQLPSEAFQSWATLNDVKFNRTVPGTVSGRGGALLAKRNIETDQKQSDVLLTVSSDLILSLERCQEHARVDRDYREVLESIGDFGRTPRGAILSFLLVQASMLNPQLSDYVGVHSAFLEYIKSLPMELLPTFWTPAELELLVGTTLAPAISAKLKSLRREYDTLCLNAAGTRWFQVVQDYLDFDDWLQVDAMYRSRALEIPGVGHCMVPCVDLANHSSGDATVALYEKDDDGNAVLLLRDGKEVDEGQEVTITYGDEKGACEMLFSYGFLDDRKDSAESLFLSLLIPEHDRLRHAKMEISDCAPGFKLIDGGHDDIDWSGDFVWLLCATEDDGFRFEIARTIDGGTETDAFFQAQRIANGAAELYKCLKRSELWDVYRLRATTILQQRVFDQLQLLYTTQDDVEATPHGHNSDVRDSPFQLAMRLRTLEFDLMNRAYEQFEQQKIELAESAVVVRYLEEMTKEVPATSSAETDSNIADEPKIDDFS